MDAKLKTGIIVGAAVVGVTSVVGYLLNEFKKLYHSCYAVVGAVIHDFSMTNVRLTLFVKIENMSDITVTVDKQFYDVYLNDMQVATFQSTEPMRLTSNSEKTFPIEVQFDPTDLLRQGVSNIGNLIKNRENLEIKVKGVLSIKAGIARVDDFFMETSWSLKELTQSNPDAVDVCDQAEKEKRKQKRDSRQRR
jgi:LEA14-like dessication related protein